MKVFIVFLFATVFAVFVAAVPENICENWGTLYKAGDNSCEPEKSFFSECNSCKCSKDGSNATCTQMECSDLKEKCRTIFKKTVCKNFEPLFKEGVDTCENGKAFYSECNSCKCSNDGKSAVCTKMSCEGQREICNYNN